MYSNKTAINGLVDQSGPLLPTGDSLAKRTFPLTRTLLLRDLEGVVSARTPLIGIGG